MALLSPSASWSWPDAAQSPQGAIRWLELLTSLVSNDPGVLCKLGAIHYR